AERGGGMDYRWRDILVLGVAHRGGMSVSEAQRRLRHVTGQGGGRMRRAIAVVAVLGGLAAGWWLWPRGAGDLSGGEATAVRAGLAARMGGAAALVLPVRAATDPQGKLVCGWARRDDAMGAGTGNMPFVGLLGPRGFAVAQLAIGEAEVAAVRGVCGQGNLPI
ncbi:MAG TPA: hypothetical protein PKE47_01980, partial [Verrucomicrobiota bacterium]|nr:hypothetical protein [Verrucomicrobiota bacterium]